MSDLLGESVRQAANSQAAYVRSLSRLEQALRERDEARAVARRFRRRLPMRVADQEARFEDFPWLGSKPDASSADVVSETRPEEESSPPTEG